MRLAGLSTAQIDEVILVGGTTRIPYVRERVGAYFGKPPRTDVDPDQAVALGAAIQAAGIAAMLDKPTARPVTLPLPAPSPSAAAAPPLPPAAARAPKRTMIGTAPAPPIFPPAPAGPPPIADDDVITDVAELAPDPEEGPTNTRDLAAVVMEAHVGVPSGPVPTLLEVTPRGLSVATVSGFCELLVKRNARIPLEQTREFMTAKDDQEAVEIRVFQGESRRLEENTLMGTLVLDGLPRRPRGQVRIAVTFGITPDGMLVVDAKDVATGKAQSARIYLLGAQSTEDVSAARERLAAIRR
jgi:molecular chaperone DnaK